ncbi:MAG: hypothetical protein HC833_17860 [Leptolyngbyaceae cyanobacterium RM1_406_9]|nr:hypothetical protein [Leptolyngbyaceae cyanobacterium SM1_4_3]NJO75461.1 hypothetical protein [Leptolyngbyaceae cyanobacterium RM1_406_9]
MSSYRDSLHPWCIVRSFPSAHTLVVARFRRRNDAEAQLRTLQRLIPTASFCIVFDAGQQFDQPGGEGEDG